MLSFFSSFTNIFSWSNKINPPYESDSFVLSCISKIKTDTIQTPVCILRLDTNFKPKEYFINFSFDINVLILYIKNALLTSEWMIRTWDDTWATHQDVGYLIELNNLKTLEVKKLWFFNLSNSDQQAFANLHNSFQKLKL